MWISRKKLTELLERNSRWSYEWGYQNGQIHALKEILRWRRILESGPMGIVAEQIEQILRRKGL